MAHPAPASPSLTTAAMLRTVRFELGSVSVDLPYRAARLRRLTEQLTFIVQTWAGLPWPTHSRQGHPVPSPDHVLHQLGHLPAEPADQHRALLVLVLLLL
ncbi:hypothetical protein DNI29_22410 [Hymenobacter sediminis]|uniref:hypothetical protein n=1 Tax=Hymenobacter sediminis TaxID=2218621 RepID=UPI000F50C8B4|nr:hypothetical protein [Hymenobacter sediminis]RPD44152.1 hypothetical protein DNI29_22410 [Hymenobacter sediminis]